MIVAALVLAADPGVICISTLPPPSQYATANKGASTPEDYEDTPEARERRVALAKKRKPVVFSVGDVQSVGVTDERAACIDGLPLGRKQTLKSDGRALLTFTLQEDAPVRWLNFNAFYGTDRLDPLPPRLFCPKRAATPDCSWCPCKSKKYEPPPRPASQPGK